MEHNTTGKLAVLFPCSTFLGNAFMIKKAKGAVYTANIYVYCFFIKIKYVRRHSVPCMLQICQCIVS